MSDDYKWSDEENQIVPETPETHCYWNPNGCVVIRQRGEVFEDDPYVYLHPLHIPALIERLVEELVKYENPFVLDELRHRLRYSGLFAQHQAVEPEPKQPMTAAERQRRRRERRREQDPANDAQPGAPMPAER